MRLMNTSTYELREFFGSEIPDYAILSHRWQEEEVTYQDLHLETRTQMKGWAKVSSSCAQAKKEGWDCIWIDSCCIDKSSSAELSEAINSMFRWYQQASVCYAYLFDVRPGQSRESHLLEGSDFQKSKWFGRGWTLQELLAPDTVVFFDLGWREIGTKSSLDELLTVITGIQDLTDYEDASVAQKMSWASKRETLREEDIAYSLMGLFKVHMPLLYGEGKNAFIRLQLEILKVSMDESIFAWTEDTDYNTQRGLLASSPQCFKDSGDVILPFKVSADLLEKQKTHYMTNKGLQIEFEFFRCPAEDAKNREQSLTRMLHLLKPWDDPKPILSQLGELPSNMTLIHCFKGDVHHQIVLEISALPGGRNEFARVNCRNWIFNSHLGDHVGTVEVFIKQPSETFVKLMPKELYIEGGFCQKHGFQTIRYNVYPGISKVESIRTPHKIKVDLDLVLVTFLNSKEHFTLALEYSPLQGIGIAFHQSTKTQDLKARNVDDVVARMRRYFRDMPRMTRMKDRASIDLVSGYRVTAALRKVGARPTSYYVLTMEKEVA